MTKDELAIVEAAAEGDVPLSSGFGSARCPKPWEVPEAVREHFRRAHASLRRTQGNHLVIAVCSLARKEGVSYVTAKLACAAAEVEDSVFLLDANRYRPSQEHIFGLGTASDTSGVSPGLQNMVACKTPWPSLSLVLPGDSATEDHGSTAGLCRALIGMRSLAGMTFVDCEALRESSQVVQLAPALDGVLFVVEAERERREAIADAVAQLKRAEIPVLGLIVNKQRRYLPAMLYRAL